VPESFAVPGAIRTQTDGAVVSAVVRVFSETQLDVVRQMEGVRVSEFPINLEDIFIELLGPAATSPMERSI
jgi:hypothetical protein